MTTIMFVSDIHLNTRITKEWEVNRFTKLVDELYKYPADYLVLGGDIFDKANPNLEEIHLFYHMISKLKDRFKEIIVISGNHEDLNKKETTYHKLPTIGFTYLDFTSSPYITTDGCSVYFVSHHKINDITDIEVSDKTNLLFSHIRANIGVVKAETNLLKISKHFDKVILGDIHIPYAPYKNVEYCGSPYTIQYEPERASGIFKITLDKGSVTTQFISFSFLPQKVKYIWSVEEYQERVKALNPENLYKIVLEGSVKTIESYNIPKNVNLLITEQSSQEYEEEMISEVRNSGSIDVIDTFMRLLSMNENVTDEMLNVGTGLVEEFKRNYYD